MLFLFLFSLSSTYSWPTFANKAFEVPVWSTSSGKWLSGETLLRPVGCRGPCFLVNFGGKQIWTKKKLIYPTFVGVNFVGWIFWGTDFCLGKFCWVNFGNWVIHSVRSGLFVANRRPFLINSMWKNNSGSVLFCYSSLWLWLLLSKKYQNT